MSCRQVKPTVSSATSFSCIGDKVTDVRQVIKRLLVDCRGASLVEFTLVLPVILSLTFGVVEFSRIIHHYHIVQKSVRDSARYLARVPVDPQVTCPPTSAAWVIATTRAQNLALTGTIDGVGQNLLAYWTNPATVSISIVCLNNAGGAYAGQAFIPSVTVTAAVPYQDVGFLAFFGFNAPTLTASNEQVMIGG